MEELDWGDIIATLSFILALIVYLDSKRDKDD